MLRMLCTLGILAALLVTVTCVWAATPREKELLMRYENTDVDPNIGPVAPGGMIDDQWDLLAVWDLNAIHTSALYLGCEHDGTHWIVTNSGASSGSATDNEVVRINDDGTFYDYWMQPTTSGWGWRDLAYDGTYIYGSGNNIIYAYAPDGTPAPPGFNITGPLNPNRALAYDPVDDAFWTANWGPALYKVYRDGTYEQGTTTAGSVYGAAWDDFAPDGPWLWLYGQSGSPGCLITKYDPINWVTMPESYQIPLPPGYTSNIAGGLCLTDQWDPTWWVFGAVGQGSPQDNLMILEMYDNIDPGAPAAVENFTLTNNGPDLLASLSWDNPTLTFGGDPLAEITSIEVLRNGESVASLTGNPGDHMTYDNIVPAAGMYTYSVYCMNSFGFGPSVSDNEPIGLDVPAGVTDLVGSGVGTSLIAELSWTNPTTGANGGYFPPGSIDGYTINRYGPDPATINVVGMATSYTDNTISVQGFYIYGVIPYNSTGNGPEVMTDEFYVGPPQFEEIPYDWVEINPSYPGALPGVTAGITGDDQNVGPFPIGFSFPWYDGAMFTNIRLCSNGWASFTSTVSTWANQPIPTSSEPNNLVAPYWDDLNFNVGYYGHGTAWYYYDTANERFIAEWDSVAHYGSTIVGEYFTFEIILYPDGTIDYQYKAIVPGTLTPFPSATVGIENATGTVGVQCTYNGSGPLEPESEMGIRMYPVGAPAIPDLDVLLVPFTYPIQIPASGGSFEFYAFVTNNEATAAEADLWIYMIYPDGTVSDPLLGPGTANLQPGTTGWYRIQNVAGSAMPGEYTYVGNAGDYPDAVWAEDSFNFTKLETGDGPWVGDWTNWGDAIFEEAIAVNTALPSEFAAYPAYPNPFNPTTSLRFSLPEAARVSLSVYDVSGRLVANLVDGWRDAGQHEAVFDASNLASGLYVYRLTAGTFSATGKMVFMK